MFSYLRKKVGKTPYRWDWIKLITTSLFCVVSFYIWPSAVYQTAIILLGTLAVTEIAAFFIIPSEKRKHLWTHIYEAITFNASVELFTKAENNQLTLEDAKWLTMPGLLRDKADFKGGIKVQDQLTVMHWLAHHGNKLLIEFFKTLDANVHKENSYCGTPFHVAVSRNHHQLLDLLYFHESQLSYSSAQGTPIQCAAREGYLEIFEFLQNKKPLAKPTEKIAVIDGAINGDHQAILKTYQERYGDVLKMYPDILGSTAANNKINCLRYLISLASKEEINAPNDKGFTAAQLAHKTGHKECYDLLVAKGATPVMDDFKDPLPPGITPAFDNFTPFKIAGPQRCGETDKAFRSRNAVNP